MFTFTHCQPRRKTMSGSDSRKLKRNSDGPDAARHKHSELATHRKERMLLWSSNLWSLGEGLLGPTALGGLREVRHGLMSSVAVTALRYHRSRKKRRAFPLVGRGAVGRGAVSRGVGAGRRYLPLFQALSPIASGNGAGAKGCWSQAMH